VRRWVCQKGRPSHERSAQLADFFFQYGLFFLKVITLAAVFAGAAAVIFGLVSRAPARSDAHIEVTRVNERLKNEKETLQWAMLEEGTHALHEKELRTKQKRARKEEKKAQRALRKAPGQEPSGNETPRTFVLDFDGDLQASAVANLRRELSAILALASTSDEVVLRLQSGGGLVHAYGLAASQLTRVKNKGIRLVICVDRVAASGGYMMACVADHLIAAPFAVIGSIGVVAQFPNFNRLLRKHNVDFELATAGEYKRTLTIFGENTPEGRKKFQEDLEDTHAVFKEFVATQRPKLDIEKVGTGEIWLGVRALSVALVDEIKTSDEYITDACQTRTVLEVRYVEKKSLRDKVLSSLEASAERILLRVWSRATRPTL
jgi:serine protease SohB